MLNFFNQTVTIYNDLHTVENRFRRSTIRKCSIQGGLADKGNGTISNVLNLQKVITKDVQRYRAYLDFVELSPKEQGECYTIQNGDFVIFAEVNDVVNTAQDFANLQKKYSSNGIKVMTYNVHSYGAKVDNITIMNL